MKEMGERCCLTVENGQTYDVRIVDRQTNKNS